MDKVESKIVMVAMCSVPELDEEKDEKEDKKKLKELLQKEKVDQ